MLLQGVHPKIVSERLGHASIGITPYLTHQREDQARRRAELGTRWKETDLVVDSGDGGAVSPVNFSSAWPRFLRRSGLPHVRFHDLRHGHATLMLIQGVHPKVVSERLGHSSIGITLDCKRRLKTTAPPA